MVEPMTGPAGLEIIKRNEGLRLDSYQDVAGVWTIGYGDTGPDVRSGMSITPQQAEERLLKRLAREFEPAVRDAIKGAAVTQNQFDAMVSLAYNIGVGAFSGSSVARKHKAGDYQGAADAFRLWNKAGGRVWPGLSRRREEERSLYLSEVPQATERQIRSIDLRRAEQALVHFREATTRLQERLKAVGFDPGPIDGIFGKRTEDAVVAYMKAYPR
jgi:lysozyme